jgi:hypothetical protein
MFIYIHIYIYTHTHTKILYLTLFSCMRGEEENAAATFLIHSHFSRVSIHAYIFQNVWRSERFCAGNRMSVHVRKLACVSAYAYLHVRADV